MDHDAKDKDPEDLMRPESDTKGKQRVYAVDSDSRDSDPKDAVDIYPANPVDKQACRLMPKNYKKKPPMHSGSVYNAAALVRSKSTYGRNASPPGAFSTPDKSASRIENLVSKQTPPKGGLVWGGGDGGSPRPFATPDGPATPSVLATPTCVESSGLSASDDDAN